MNRTMKSNLSKSQPRTSAWTRLSVRFSAVFGGVSELGEAEFTGDKIEHGDHVSG